MDEKKATWEPDYLHARCQSSLLTSPYFKGEDVHKILQQVME